jgi:hypothetical protein
MLEVMVTGVFLGISIILFSALFFSLCVYFFMKDLYCGDEKR